MGLLFETDLDKLLETAKQILILRGGPTSGNWVHDGRPGTREGSGRGGGFKRMRLKKGSTRGAILGISRRNRKKRKQLRDKGLPSGGRGFTKATPISKKPRKTEPGSGGKKVSEALNLGKVPKSGAIGSEVRSTIGIINSVHSDGNLKNIPVKISNGTRTFGSYAHRSVSPVHITVSRKSTHPRNTMAHEVGHFLDHQAIGSPGTFSDNSSAFFRATDKDSAVGGKAKALHDAMNNSATIKTLKNDTPNQSVKLKHTNMFGQETEIEYKADKKYINYLLKPQEQFARGYSQYIATKSQDPAMLKELDGIRKDNSKSGQVNYHTQWSDKDFKPISKAFDDLFLEMGWEETQEND